MEFDKFVIGFEGLKLGEHDYKFLVDTTFFKELEYSEIQEGKVIVDAVLIKTERLMELDMSFEGEVIVPCDRCGEDLKQKVDFQETVVIKFDDEADEDQGMIVLKRGETDFDISHYIFESIILSLPSRKVHAEIEGEPRCDEALMAKINSSNKSNDNDNDNIDPRWAALKNLK